ncbi:MAG: DJ-1/PfpI family protein [Alphaproteobacteria bacterium]|nr:DJ-1/PfpI family protein [Alphaproteobacteria bacterium]
MSEVAPPAAPGERIALLIYPGFTALDLFGPHHMLAGLRPARLDLVARTRDPVTTDTGAKIIPAAAFDEIDEGLDILLVPGGTEGTLAAMQDPMTRAFIARQAASAHVVSSVCTGSLILAAAGVLRGRRATSHWLTLDILRMFGAEPVAERVVEDDKFITGAGVSAGLDLGLTLVQRLRGTEYAQGVQLVAEYDPRPPLAAGSPVSAPAPVVTRAREHFAAFNARLAAAASNISGPALSRVMSSVADPYPPFAFCHISPGSPVGN